MPTTDQRGPAPSFELLLERALEVEPPPRALERMERHVERAIVERQAADGRNTLFPRTGWRFALVFAVAALALAGAATALTLLEQAAALMPGWRIAYERATPIAQSQTVGGWTVTLDRAYADPNQLVLAFTTSGPQGTRPAVVRASVTDEEGRHYLEFAGGDIPVGTAGIAASISSHDVPPGADGTLRLHVRADELMIVSPDEGPAPAGPWRFDIDVPMTAARTVTPDLTAEAAGVAVTLDWVRFSPTAIRVRLDADLAAVRTGGWDSWWPEATIQRNGAAPLPLDWSPFPSAWTGQPKEAIAPIIDAADGSEIVRQTETGTDSPAGRWTLTIHRLFGGDGSGNVREVAGPWRFELRVP